TGKACDVYFYPRKDGWIIGGSRQPGRLHKGDFKPEAADPQSSSYEISSNTIPAPIIDLNRAILHHTFEADLGDKDSLNPLAGYRYIRNSNKDLRLEKETVSGKQVIHNYGH